MYRSTAIDGIEILDISGPVSVQFEVTSNCNYRCRFCYNVWKDASSSKKRIIQDLRKEQHFEILNKLLPIICSIIFSGGEPTLVPWLADLVSFMTEKNIRCSIITNGALVSEELAYKLKNAGLAHAQISIHHFDSEIHDELTGAKDSFFKSLAGAQALSRAMGSKRVNINMVVNSETARDVYEMGKLFSEQGFNRFSVGMQSCSGAANDGLQMPTISDFLGVYNQLSRLNNDFGMRTGIVGGIPICAIPRAKNPRVRFYNICDAAITQMVIAPNGDCRPCVEISSIGGNILENTVEEIWKSSVFESIRLFENVPPECCKCKWVSTCHGGCRASAQNYSGTIKGRTPLMPKELPDDFILA